jgi:hypothetical protein
LTNQVTLADTFFYIKDLFFRFLFNVILVFKGERKNEHSFIFSILSVCVFFPSFLLSSPRQSGGSLSFFSLYPALQCCVTAYGNTGFRAASPLLARERERVCGTLLFPAVVATYISQKRHSHSALRKRQKDGETKQSKKRAFLADPPFPYFL